MSQALQLSSEQSKAVVALWHNFNQQVSKLLEQRHGIHKSISETAHGGIDGQEFAQNYLQAQSPQLSSLPFQIQMHLEA